MAKRYERTRDCISTRDIHISPLEAAVVLSRAKSTLKLPYFESLYDRRYRYRSLNFNNGGSIGWFYKSLALNNVDYHTCTFCRDAMPQNLEDFGRTSKTLCKYCQVWKKVAPGPASMCTKRARDETRLCPVAHLQFPSAVPPLTL